MATSIIKLHTLSGAGDGGPPCFILQVDDFHCLLDCGWHDKMSSEYCPTISKWARHIDAVLLSHQSLRHLGLLPYLVGTCGLKCPIYATTPVYKMGQLTLYDFYQSVYSSEDFSLFTLDDIDAAFDMVIQVKYQQKVNLPGRGQGLCITALPSGHTLGGTIWKLVKEDTDIVYAVDFNHKKDRHLNGATFDACMRPHLLILDSSNILYTHVRRKDRDENLRQSILRTLRRGGNVLLVVDTAGRCLEVAHFLEQCWLNQDSGMMAYGLAMLSNVAFNVVDFAKSLVEWMSEKVVRTFEDQRSNPFHFRHMQLCHTLEQLDDVPEPKVVLASSFDMNYGFAKQLFAEWADNDLNTVILTTRESHVSSKDPTTGQLTIMNRLIGLAQGDPTARDGLPTSSTGTLVLPMSLSQRVLASQLESMENQMPRVRNAVQQPGSETSPDEVSMNELHTEIPLADGSSAINGDDTPMDEQSTPTPDVDVPDTSLSVSPTKLIPTPSAQTITAPRPSITLTAGAHGEVQTPLNKLYQRSTSVVSKKLEHTMLDSQPSLVPSTQLTVGRHQPGYDIYPGLHNHAGGQFFRMAKRTQLLFPQVEKRIHWDDYGGFLDHDLFATDDKPGNLTLALTDKIKAEKPITPVTAEPKSVALVSSSILDCLAPKAGLTDDPENKTHVVTHQLEIPLRCELIFLDFEGRSDGEAMKRIILGLRPLEVIIVGNSGEAVDHLAQYCRTAMHLRSDLVHVPHGCEVVNCTKEEDIYQARMKDSLVSSLKFTKIHNYELAWVEATLTMESDNTEDVEMREDEQEKEEEEEAVEGGRKLQLPISADRFPVLSLPTGPVEAHKTVFVNKPRLSDLKQLLLAQGMVAEFMSGVLVVENCVAIKGSEAGKLVLEGLLSRTYFDVRKILYQQFAIL